MQSFYTHDEPFKMNVTETSECVETNYIKLTKNYLFPCGVNMKGHKGLFIIATLSYGKDRRTCNFSKGGKSDVCCHISVNDYKKELYMNIYS